MKACHTVQKSIFGGVLLYLCTFPSTPNSVEDVWLTYEPVQLPLPLTLSRGSSKCILVHSVDLRPPVRLNRLRGTGW
jgi:hypothetical protein